MTAIDLDALAEEVRNNPRLTRDSLLRILQQCYEAGRWPLLPKTKAMLRAKIASIRAADGANRSYVVTGNDYTLIVRYVFSPIRERSNASRYATALHYLAGPQVKPDDFHKSIAEQGGLTSIYWHARQRQTKTMNRSKLTLSTTISVAAGRLLTLVLMPEANGIFNVISAAQEPAMKQGGSDAEEHLIFNDRTAIS